MPDYAKLHELVSHRVVLEYDTGARIVGYLAQCVPGTGSVQLVQLQHASVFDADGKEIESYEQMAVCPNILTGLHKEEGPSGRSLNSGAD